MPDCVLESQLILGSAFLRWFWGSMCRQEGWANTMSTGALRGCGSIWGPRDPSPCRGVTVSGSHIFLGSSGERTPLKTEPALGCHLRAWGSPLCASPLEPAWVTFPGPLGPPHLRPTSWHVTFWAPGFASTQDLWVSWNPLKRAAVTNMERILSLRFLCLSLSVIYSSIHLYMLFPVGIQLSPN